MPFRSLLPLAPLALLLAACGGTPQPVPLASNFGQTYTRTVGLTGWSEGAVTFRTPLLDVTLDPAGRGTLALTPQASLPAQPSTAASLLASLVGCPNLGGLAVQGDTNAFAYLPYWYVSLPDTGRITSVVDLANDKVFFERDAAGTDGSVFDDVGGKDADFFFVNQAVSVKGNVTCGGQAVAYDVTLQPGWNLVSFAYSGSGWTVRNDTEAGLTWRLLPIEDASAQSAQGHTVRGARSAEGVRVGRD